MFWMSTASFIRSDNLSCSSSTFSTSVSFMICPSASVAVFMASKCKTVIFMDSRWYCFSVHASKRFLADSW